MDADDIPPLVAADCPLLDIDPAGRDRVLAAYAAAREQWLRLRKQAPEELANSEVAQAVRQIAEVRRRLARQTYLVGFLGPSQAGKSTTVNNLVGRKVSPQGEGEATTCVVTRLAIAPKDALTLHYFSGERYRERRTKLCDWAQLPNTDNMTEAQVLDKLASHTPSQKPGSSARRVLAEDVPYLRCFLKSHQDHAAGLIAPSGKAVDASFEQRDTLLTHGTGLASSPSLLLAEAVLGFPSDVLDAKLELIDCPGIGASRSVDSLLTKEYLPTLDGALVFCRADEPFAGTVEELLADLKDSFTKHGRGGLASRVWVVVNKMDVPSREAKLGDGDKSLFATVRKFEPKHGIPLDQIVFGCEDIHKLAKKGPFDRAAALDKIKLEPEDESVVAQRLADCPPLQKAFEGLLTDGGVGYLRTLIREVIGKAVAGQILRDAEAVLRDAGVELDAAVKRAGNPLKAGELQAARLWWSVISGQTAKLSSRNAFFEERGKQLRVDLEAEFDKAAQPNTLRLMSPDELLNMQYPVDAAHLQDELARRLDQMNKDGFDDVATALAAGNLPDLAVRGDSTPMALWRRFRAEDAGNTAWLADALPTLYQPALLGQLASPHVATPLDGATYRALLVGKIRSAAHRGTRLVSDRVRSRLKQLAEELRRRIGTPA